MSRASRTAVALAAVLLSTACSPQDLLYRNDNRLSITAPEDRGMATLPVTLRWTISNFEITEPGSPVEEDAGYFAVFVDRPPVPPGKSLQWISRDDPDCRTSDGCPDEEYLTARGVYVTSDTQLTIGELAVDEDEDRRERHRATIVLLDGSGQRIGESAWDVLFEVDRGEQS